MDFPTRELMRNGPPPKVNLGTEIANLQKLATSGFSKLMIFETQSRRRRRRRRKRRRREGGGGGGGEVYHPVISY